MAKLTNYKLIAFDPTEHALSDVEDLISTIDLAKTYLTVDDVKLPTHLLAFQGGDFQNPTSPQRFTAVRKILIGLSISFLTNIHRPQSLHGIVHNLCNLVKWADRSVLPDLFADPAAYRNAVDHRVQHLQAKLQAGELAEHTVATETIHCMMGGVWVYDLPLSYFQEGVKRIKRSRKNLDALTEPPSYHVVRECYSLNHKLFNQLTDFLLNHRSFPHQISLPKEKVWVLPTKSWGATEDILSTLPPWGKSKYWDYRTGQLFTPEQTISWSNASSERVKYRCNEKLQSERKKLKEANKNFFSWQRIILAQWAHDAFLTMFTANTSANEDSIRAFPWDDELVVKDCIHPSGLKLRAIKYRAHGKNVEFEIRAKFLSTFEKFLSLRKFILNGREHKFLLLSIYRDNEIRQLPLNALRRHYLRIQAQLYPKFTGVGYREWRASTGSVVFDAVGVDTAAAILQNSPESIIRSYSKGTIEGWEKDISEYFNAFSKEFRKFKKRSIPIGNCNGEQNPRSIIPTAPIQPDCSHFEGCLNCDKFSLHADEDDIRKILSMQYVILASEPSARTKKSFDHAFSALLRKIEWILGEIASIDPIRKALVDTIREDVFENESLTDYWQFKLNMLVEMGVIQ